MTGRKGQTSPSKTGRECGSQFGVRSGVAASVQVFALSFGHCRLLDLRRTQVQDWLLPPGLFEGILCLLGGVSPPMSEVSITLYVDGNDAAQKGKSDGAHPVRSNGYDSPAGSNMPGCCHNPTTPGQPRD